MRNSTTNIKKIVRISAVGALLAAVAFLPPTAPHAQRSKQSPAKLTGINSRPTPSGEVITVSADAPLNGTQTWQDGEGFHMTLPGAQRNSLRGVRGVKVREVGDSTEIVVPVKDGASVTVQPGSNRVELVVNGGIDQSQAGAEPDASTQNSGGEPRAAKQSQPAARTPRAPRVRQNAQTAQTDPTPPQANQETEEKPQPVPSDMVAQNNASSSNVPVIVPAQANARPNNAPAAPPAQPAVPAGQDGFGTTVESVIDFLSSTTGIVILCILGLGMILFLVKRRRDESGWEDIEPEKEIKTTRTVAKTTAVATANKSAAIVPANSGAEQKTERRKGRGRRGGDRMPSNNEQSQNVEQSEPTMEINRQGTLVPAVLFGAYRVDQEVGKLLLGQPHRMDVLASRATDDRRAVETSLLKAMNAQEMDEDARRRARVALEEYGFVARQCAALLLATNAYERASAARTLGEIKSPASLQFLLEALYDSDEIVRTHAVTALGALRLPSAIGALLDMARRHPEMPSSLLSRALSDCSVEALDFSDAPTLTNAFLALDDGKPFTGEITQLEPAARVEELPVWLEDDSLAEALARLQNADVEARIAAAASLSQFHVQRSVEALTMIAGKDEEPSVRAAAVTSLSAIDHESVFGPVLIAFADEAREVRAAAARALSRLNFDRADAFVRVIETADPEMLSCVARACIKAGMVSQAIDRLASEDRRQAYESFSLLSLLAKSNENGLILEAIERHSDINVRLSAVRLLGLAGQPEVVQQLRQLAVRDSVPDKVRTALLDVVYKIDQAQLV